MTAPDEPEAVAAVPGGLRPWFERNRALIGKFVFELIVVFVGVTAAFAMEDLRQRADEAEYRQSMISALVPTLDNVVSHSTEFERVVGGKLAAFDAALARGERPALRPIPSVPRCARGTVSWRRGRPRRWTPSYSSS